MVFFPGAEVAMLLGKAVYVDDRLLVIGTDEAVTRPEKLGVNELNEVVSYLSYHRDVDVNSFSEEDAKQVKDNWRTYLVGNEETNDMSDPDIIEDMWENIELYMDYLYTMSEDYIVDYGLGDWCALPETDICSVALTSIVYYYADAVACKKMAALSENGYADILYKMITVPTMPSYAYWINSGMTTFAEC